MRAKSDPWFVDYLLCACGGPEEASGDDGIHIPHDMGIAHRGRYNMLIDCIFPNLNENM